MKIIRRELREENSLVPAIEGRFVCGREIERKKASIAFVEALLSVQLKLNKTRES